MELKSMIQFEVKKEDRVYNLYLPMGASFGESYDVVFEFLKQITQMMQQNTQNSEQKSTEIVEEAK